MRIALLLAVLVLVLAPVGAAQVGIDFNIGPTVNWTEDVTAFFVDIDNPDPELGLEVVDVPVQIGLQGGLGLTVRGKTLGVRVGGRFLNTAALYDGGDEGFGLSRESFETTFVTLQLDLQANRQLGPASAYVFAGPELRYLVDLSGQIGTFDDLKEGAELLSAAANIGAGLRLSLFGTRVGPEIRYALDITGVGSGGEVPVPSGGTAELTEAFSVDTLLFGLVFGGP